MLEIRFKLMIVNFINVNVLFLCRYSIYTQNMQSINIYKQIQRFNLKTFA